MVSFLLFADTVSKCWRQWISEGLSSGLLHVVLSQQGGHQLACSFLESHVGCEVLCVVIEVLK